MRIFQTLQTQSSSFLTQRTYSCSNFVAISSMPGSVAIGTPYMTIYMLHYNPRHVSNSTKLIFRRSYCIIAASGIITVCKLPYSTPVESGLLSTYNSLFCSTVDWLVKLIISFSFFVSALNRRIIRQFTESDGTRCCNNTI